MIILKVPILKGFILPKYPIVVKIGRKLVGNRFKAYYIYAFNITQNKNAIFDILAQNCFLKLTQNGQNKL